MRYSIILLFALQFLSQSAFAYRPALLEEVDTLLVGYSQMPPFVIQEGDDISGVSVWLWEKIAKEDDLPYKFKQMPFDSLLLALENHTVDVGLSPLTITSDRAKVMDFTPPYYIAHSSIMKEDVSALEKAWLFVKSFFSINFFRALGALVFVIFVFGALLWLFERKHNQEEFGGGVKGLWEGFWWSAVTMTTVGYGDKSPRSFGGRLIALVWMFTAIIIISGFTAGIASSLTVNRIDSSSGGIQDFKKKRLGSIRNSATASWLKTHFFKDKQVFEDVPAMLQALDEGEIDAVAYDSPVLKDIVMRDSLHQYKVLEGISYNPQFYAFGLGNHLSEELREYIDLAMLSNVETMDWKVLLSETNLD